MRKPGLLGLVGAVLRSCAATAAPILVNEFKAVSAANFLAGTASDTTLGHVLGNGSEWVEPVVIQHDLER